jgi:hypothetical protein
MTREEGKNACEWMSEEIKSRRKKASERMEV